MKRFAIALSALILMAGAPMQIARADDLGCQFLLCMAATNGWKSISECSSPVRKALRKMHRSSWKPRCASAGGPSSGGGGEGSYVVDRYEKYVSCDESYGDGYVQQRGGRLFGPTVAITRSQSYRDAGYCRNPTTGDAQPLLAHPDPRFIDVYVDGAHYNRVYWTLADAELEDGIE